MPAPQSTLNQMPQLRSPETALALDMLHTGRAGRAVLNFAVDIDGRGHLRNPPLEQGQFTELADRFRGDPKDTLAAARESLLAVGTDKHTPRDVRERRLGGYLDAYTALTLKLDHAAYPATRNVRYGVPGYIPDGFVDMGGDSSSLDPLSRGREMIRVDKAAILQHYKPLLTELFTREYGTMSRQQRKLEMANRVAQAVYFNRPYSKDLAKGKKSLGGGIVDLSKVSDFVCRHQALEFQVLSQAIGIKSQLLKCRATFFATGVNGRHVANLVRLDDDWYIYDVTNPDHTVNGRGEDEWKPGLMRITRPPRSGEPQKYHVVTPLSREARLYEVDRDGYWHIDRQ